MNSGPPKPLTADEIAAWKKETSGYGSSAWVRRCVATIEQQAAQIEKLREDFREYACHTDYCYSPGEKCTCGLDEALAATRRGDEH